MIISNTEYEKIVNWNQANQDYPQDKTLSQLFEEQVKNTLDNTAVVLSESFIELSSIE